jgi:dTDP-4-amino-4,6-dideoxygalactose transaminase
MTTTATTFLPWHRALIEEEEIKAVVDVLQSGWLTTGPRVKEFEAAFARFTGARHAVAVSSCTAALHLGLATLNLQQGDEVILPSMTFASSGEVVLYFGARPVLVDCGAHSFHMDPALVEAAVTDKTRAIMPVHYAGFPCEMDAILEIARRHSLKVIEDAAHAFPSRYKGQMVGTIGDITCFSFYATKTMTTGEGGMITTDDAECADRMRILSLHGISRDSWKRYMAGGKWRYEILETGYKYNMTDLQAAIGLAQLAKCESMHLRRGVLAHRYDTMLASHDAFVLPTVPEDVEHAWHLYVVQLKPGTLRIDRDRVVEELQKLGIGTSVHFIPLHTHPLYREKCGYRDGQFPNAEKRFAGSISLPLYPGLTFEEQDRVVEALSEIARDYRG